MNFEVKDESGDRKYFTIIPNYILNHSTATAQALYMQLKRLAGENGLAYPSRDFLVNQLKISKPTLRKEFIYLLEKGWIEYVGEKEVMTAGGNQKVKAYRINDIWKLNCESYKNQRGEKIEPTLLASRGEKIEPQRGEKIDPLIRTNNTKEELIKKIKIRKKYSSIKDIQNSDLLEISEKYKVNLSFVNFQFEKLKNYCEAQGRVYKNYKSALRNFILGDMQRSIERRQNDTKSGIDARNF